MPISPAFNSAGDAESIKVGWVCSLRGVDWVRVISLAPSGGIPRNVREMHSMLAQMIQCMILQSSLRTHYYLSLSLFSLNLFFSLLSW